MSVAANATVERPTYVVTAPCVVVKGERGSSGIFYESASIREWPTGVGGDDSPTDEEIGRLLDLGMIEAV